MYLVTWPNEPEVMYPTREALDSAVSLRLETFVEDLESRLETGWTMIQRSPDSVKLHDLWVELYQRYDFLIRRT